MAKREYTAEEVEEDCKLGEELADKLKDLLADHVCSDYQRQFARHAIALVMVLGDTVSQEAVQSQVTCDCGDLFGHLIGRIEHVVSAAEDRALWKFGHWLASQDFENNPELFKVAINVVARRNSKGY